MQQPRPSTICQRLLRNQFFWKFVVKFGDQHASDYRHPHTLRDPCLRPVAPAFSRKFGLFLPATCWYYAKVSCDLLFSLSPQG
jgi:hypothetical protein